MAFSTVLNYFKSTGQRQRDLLKKVKYKPDVVPLQVPLLSHCVTLGKPHSPLCLSFCTGTISGVKNQHEMYFCEPSKSLLYECQVLCDYIFLNTASCIYRYLKKHSLIIRQICVFVEAICGPPPGLGSAAYR